MHSPSRPVYVLLALVFVGFCWTIWRFPVGSSSRPRGLHYILPATKADFNVCRLLLTGAATGFPDPVLLGWQGVRNETVGHLFKLPATLKYLNNLRPEQDDDLVLMLDAFDVWLQLPPQALIERYYQAVEKQDQRLRERGLLGKKGEDGVKIRSSILFGGDKLCWPGWLQDLEYCFSVPKSTLPDDIFGPATDSGRKVYTRPTFLNSGTIMGPVKDIRALLTATSEAIDLVWDEGFMHKTSDQHYLAIVKFRQDAARRKVEGTSRSTQPVSGRQKKLTSRAEFSVFLDYESDVVQINNWYQPYIAWMSYNHSTVPSQRGLLPPNDPGRLDRLRLEPEISALPGPFSMSSKEDSLPRHLSWKDVMLGTNVVLGKVFPIFHITARKDIIDDWWAKQWVHPHGKALLRAARQKRLAATSRSLAAEDTIAEVRGIRYITVPVNGAVEGMKAARDKANEYGGAWSDTGDYLTWEHMCKEHEPRVFVKHSVHD